MDRRTLAEERERERKGNEWNRIEWRPGRILRVSLRVMNEWDEWVSLRLLLETLIVHGSWAFV